MKISWWPFNRVASSAQKEVKTLSAEDKTVLRPTPKRRRVQLGIDYGTSTSKMVLRDYLAAGEERAVVLSKNGSYRFSSSVRLTGDTLLFGSTPTDELGSASQATWYESIKMRVAAEARGNHERYCYGPLPDLPPNLTSRDLAVLTLWWLISEGSRAASDLIPDSEIVLGMTVGIPMSFFVDQTLRETFLDITKAAWTLYRQSGLLPEPALTLANAQSLLRAAYSSAPSIQVPADRLRDWIRSEAEAAMWWAFQSPAVPAGTFAKVDIGAGTTNASVFRIGEDYSNNRWVKSRLVFYGADSLPMGMDALDETLSHWKASDPKQCLQYRGLEDDLLSTQPAVQFCRATLDGIVRASRMPWKQLQQKLGGYVGRDPDWRKCRTFLIGGGSLVRQLRKEIPVYPFDQDVRLIIQDLEAPPDLRMMDLKPAPREVLPFVLVAYGLSQLGLAVPEVNTPDEIDALPPMRVRKPLDHEDLYPS